ncbi:hypothetical protein B0H12DRAFT_1067175 [Mycena haematopus]|nr:hypothetical protein B0H12DRAFT_1067175 [Mycena haematopus]
MSGSAEPQRDVEIRRNREEALGGDHIPDREALGQESRFRPRKREKTRELTWHESKLEDSNFKNLRIGTAGKKFLVIPTLLYHVTFFLLTVCAHSLGVQGCMYESILYEHRDALVLEQNRDHENPSTEKSSQCAVCMIVCSSRQKLDMKPSKFWDLAPNASTKDNDTRIYSRYDFSYTASSMPYPLFNDHGFWDALCGPDGTHFARTAVACVSAENLVSADQACVALSAGLPAFRLAVSRLDEACEVPEDIVRFLVCVRFLVSMTAYLDEEWIHFKWPPENAQSYYPPPIQTWQRPRRRPTTEELAEAEPLIVVKGTPKHYKGICSTDSITDSTDESGLPGFIGERRTEPTSNGGQSIDENRRPHVTIFGRDIYSFKETRYHFNYPTLAPSTYHRFWYALCGPDGLWFAKTALTCSNPMYGIDKDLASLALSVGLRPFRLAIYRLNETEYVPADIAEFLVRVRWLVSIADYYDEEWLRFEWPSFDLQLSYASANQPWQISSEKPDRKELEEAPALTIDVSVNAYKNLNAAKYTTYTLS